VAPIVPLMLADGAATAALARDTVFAAVMIILTGMVGVCLLVGVSRHGEQPFNLYGVNATLAALAAISVFTLVPPNATTSASGPSYSTNQLAFVAVVSLVLYGVSVLVQTVRHRDYFLPPGGSAHDEAEHAAQPSAGVAAFSGVLLLICLGVVILLAKALAPMIEAAADRMQAPKAVVGVVIAAIVLLPEGLAALRAARFNRLQNQPQSRPRLGHGLDRADDPHRHRGLDRHGLDAGPGPRLKSTVLLGLSLLVATLSLGTGRTIGLQGVVSPCHLRRLPVHAHRSVRTPSFPR
jgi:Ca2+:H+ antiporter